MPIDPTGDVVFHRQVAGRSVGRRHEAENRPVAERNRDDDGGLRPPTGAERDERGNAVTNGDALEHAGDPQIRPIEFQDPIAEQPESKKHDDAPSNSPDRRRSRTSAFGSWNSI